MQIHGTSCSISMLVQPQEDGGASTSNRTQKTDMIPRFIVIGRGVAPNYMSHMLLHLEISSEEV